MANDINNKLNRSLELTLRDSLDGLEDFTLMMASTSLAPRYEILAITAAPPKRSSTPLKPQIPADKRAITIHSNNQRANDISVACNPKKKLAWLYFQTHSALRPDLSVIFRGDIGK